MAILNDDVNQMEQFLNEAANRLIQTATTVIVIGGTFIYISPLVAVFAFIPIPVIFLDLINLHKELPKDIQKYEIMLNR